jgi:hypothetical protein
MRRIGMLEAPIASMFKTLQQAAHHVSTAFGVSSRTYGRKRGVPLQGVGQGNGAGPTIWAAISSVLIMAMATQGHGFNIISALTGVLVSMVCYAFVDDTDTAVKGEEVIGQMHEVDFCAQQVERWFQRESTGTRLTFSGPNQAGKTEQFLTSLATSS